MYETTQHGMTNWDKILHQTSRSYGLWYWPTNLNAVWRLFYNCLLL